MTNFRKWKLQNKESRENRRSSIEEHKILLEGDRPVTSVLKINEVEMVSMFKYLSGVSAYRKEVK